MVRFGMICVASLTLASTADAGVLIGNPNLGFRVDRQQGDYTGGDVTVEKVRVFDCGGGYTDYVIDKVVDPVVGYELAINGGHLCSATWFWDTDFEVDGFGVLGAFTVEATENSTAVTLSEDIPWISLNPWSLISGNMMGGGPKLVTWIE